MKTGSNWKKICDEIFIIGKTSYENEDKMNEKYLLRKLWTPMVLNQCLLLTQHDKWPC